ncbi:hypothetical protein H1R20_g13989, partial [Candolleomyces eurysporus]
MSSTAANNLSVVPVFDGSNYTRWASAMRSYLQFQSLWQIVSGQSELPDELVDTEAIPADSEAGTAAVPARKYSAEAKKLNAELRLKWVADNDSAIGALKLRIKESLHIHVNEDDAAATWATFKDKYGKTSSSQKFSWFMQLMRFQLPGTSNPHKELGPFDDLVSKLSKAGINFDDEVLSMLLIMKLPEFYRTIMPLLVRDINQDDLKLEDTKGYLVTEWERKQRPAVKPLANRISAQRAEFVPQQQQQGKKQRQHGGRGKSGKSAKAKGKARAHAADVSDSDSDYEFGDDDRLFAATALADQASQGLAASMARLEEIPDQAGPSTSKSTDRKSPSPSFTSSESSDSSFDILPTSEASLGMSQTNVAIHSYPPAPPTRPLVPKTNGRMTARGNRKVPAPSSNQLPAAFGPMTMPELIEEISRATNTPIQRKKDGKVTKFSVTGGRWGDAPFPGITLGSKKGPGGSVPIDFFTPDHKVHPRSKYTPPPTRPPRPLPTPPAPKKTHTVTLITGSGAVSRVEREVSVQKRPTPPSIYSAVEASRREASRLGVRKTTQTMKKLEIDSGVRQNPDVLQKDKDLEMAPSRSPSPMMEIMEITEEEDSDFVSIGSQPQSRKRSRSPSPDYEAPQTKRFKPRPFEDDFEEEELRSELAARTAQGLIDQPIPKERDEKGRLILPKRWCAGKFKKSDNWDFIPWAPWVSVQDSLAEFRKSPHHKGNALRIFPSGTIDVVPRQDFAPDDDVIIPKEYCWVEGQYGFEIHYGDKPRYDARRGYHWLHLSKANKWIESWDTWNTMMTADEVARHRENCSECLDGEGCGQC